VAVGSPAAVAGRPPAPADEEAWRGNVGQAAVRELRPSPSSCDCAGRATAPLAWGAVEASARRDGWPDPLVFGLVLMPTRLCWRSDCRYSSNEDSLCSVLGVLAGQMYGLPLAVLRGMFDQRPRWKPKRTSRYAHFI
jgi:hypothetical protein